MSRVDSTCGLQGFDSELFSGEGVVCFTSRDSKSFRI